MIVAGQAQYQIVKQACQLGFAPTAKTATVGSSGLLQKEVWEVDGPCAKNLLVVDVALPKSHWNDQARAFVEELPEAVRPGADGCRDGGLRHARRAGRRHREGWLDRRQGHHPGVGEHPLYRRARHVFLLHKKDPAWAYHQFMDVPFMVIQYTEMNQTPRRRRFCSRRNGPPRTRSCRRNSRTLRAKAQRMDYFILLAINGLVIGLIYALMAAGADPDLLRAQGRQFRPRHALHAGRLRFLLRDHLSRRAAASWRAAGDGGAVRRSASPSSAWC